MVHIWTKHKPEDSFFLPYQVAWIRDRSPIKVMEKSRQIGMSWATAYGTVRRQAHSPLDTWISAHNDQQGCLFIDDCRRFAQLLDQGCRALGQPTGLLDTRRPGNRHTLHFANGRAIRSLSSNPDAHAGKRGTRILDEFALHPNGEELFAIAYPGVTWGGQLEILSTHRGTQTYFNQLIQAARAGQGPCHISVHRVTLEDALTQGFLKKLKAKLPPEDPRQDMDEGAYFDYIRKQCPTDQLFAQEYLCQALDPQGHFIPPQTLEGAEYPHDTAWEHDFPLPTGSDYYLGVDVGRVHDLTALWLVQAYEGFFFTRKVHVMKGATFAQQQDVLATWLADAQLRRMCIDHTGLGRSLAESLVDRFGKGRIEPVSFTSATQDALAYPLRLALEQQTLRVPPCPLVRSHFLSVRAVITSTGHTRFDCAVGPQGHADLFWACALALQAARTGAAQAPSHYCSLGQRTPRERDRWL
jgi:phage FluMu gp28-like protein